LAGPQLKKKSRDVLGIELDEHHLKIVHLQQKSMRREFSNILVHPVRGLSDDAILLHIRQAVAQWKVADARTFLTVPLSLVITRNIEIPSQDPEEIREIVNLQASRHTPYARAEIIVDMMNLGVVRERYSKILLVIVPKETVNRQIQLIDKAGLKLERVIFPPEAIAIASSKMMGKDAEDGSYGILHMDYAFTSFIVVDSGKIVFVRGIHIGASHLADDPSGTADRFQDELEKSMETYRTDEVGAPPKALLLAGALQNISDFDDLLNETLHVRTKRVPYLDYFHMSESAKTTAGSSKIVSFLNLLAPIAMFDRLKVDLTSEEKKLKIQLERRAREMLKTGILVMILFSLIFVHVTSKISFKRAYLKQITTQYLPVRDGAKQLELMLAKTELVKSYLVSRGNSLKALTELYDVTPLDMRLAEIKYDEASQKFSIKGTSSVMSSVFAFVSDLEKSEIFKNVKAKYVTSRQEAGRDVADFEINCLVEAVPLK
jgi:Tfp pilus assembly PilM family ATPase